MSSDKPRAARACGACRKLKTRCYESRLAGGSCLRCEKLGAHCSLASERSARSPNGADSHSLASGTQDARLCRLEKAVSLISGRLGIDIEDATVPDFTSSRLSLHQQPESSNIARDTAAAPVFVIRDLATEIGVESPTAIRSAQTATDAGDPDQISDGLVSNQQASALLTIFNEHYGRWVFFDTLTSPENLFEEVKKSPLLLRSCFLIAVRHTNEELASSLAPELFEKSKSLLSTTLLSTTQNIDFFQAALILCMWSTTVGQVPLSIDSWLLSGFAIQHCISSDLFENVLGQGSPSTKRDLGLLRLWNHLCLVHLHYSVGTRRKSMIGRAQVDRCRDILASDHATNFEARMVAEVYLYWTLYENCCLTDVDLPKAQSALHQWRQNWKFVLGWCTFLKHDNSFTVSQVITPDQPRSQFLEMGFRFAQLLAYDQSLKTRSASVRESLLSEMVRLSAAIMTLAMETTDERTKHLSDHIYHMITFAAVTLCRLLHMYEEQLARSHDIADLDSLISTLVPWLKSIGLSCHAAFTLGDIVAAFHKKLRPLAGPSPMNSEEQNAWVDMSFWASFPDILGPEPTNTTNWDFLPNWEPFSEDNF